MAHPPITTSLTYLLAQANRLVSGALERLLAAEGAQVEHWRVLEVLSDEQGRSMGELAQLVLMNPPALTKLMDIPGDPNLSCNSTDQPIPWTAAGCWCSSPTAALSS